MNTQNQYNQGNQVILQQLLHCKIPLNLLGIVIQNLMKKINVQITLKYLSFWAFHLLSSWSF